MLRQKRHKLKKTTKKQKARIRMKRVQKILHAILIHLKNTASIKSGVSMKISTITSLLGRDSFTQEIIGLRGRISAARKRARSLWLYR